MKDSELKQMCEELMILLSDCHRPASDIRDWELVDRINNHYAMLENISELIILNKG